MLNIGGGELLLILLVALVVLGPDKLPDAARQAGKVMNEFRRITSGFQTELRNAMDDPVAAALKERQVPSPDPFAAYARQAEEKEARSAEAEADTDGDDGTDSADSGGGDDLASESGTTTAAESDGPIEQPDTDLPSDPEAGIPSDR